MYGNIDCACIGIMIQVFFPVLVGDAYLDEIMAVSASKVVFIIPRFEFLVSFLGQSSASALCQGECTGSMQTGSSTSNSTWPARRSIFDHQVVPSVCQYGRFGE